MEKEACFFYAIQSLGERALPYISCKNVCCCEGYGFQADQYEIELKLNSFGLE